MQKGEVVAAIADALDVAVPPMSTGSTEPKEIFILVNRTLGLGLDERLSKPSLAKAIVDIAGLGWWPACESRGGTVTLTGLTRVLDAVRFLIS